MMRRAIGVMVLVLLAGGIARGASSDPARPAAIADLRARFAELGRLSVERAAGRYPPPDWPRFRRQPDEEIEFQLRNADRILVLRAMDQAVREGSREERIGAWGMYSEMMYLKEIRKRDDYLPLLIDQMALPEAAVRPLAGILAGTITQYPSRGSLLALIDLADRVPALQERFQILAITADMIGGRLPVYQDTTEPQLQQIVADFLAYLHENRDRIRFGRDGSAHLPGGPRGGKPKSLTGADRQRVRDDPVCVLRLLHQSFVKSPGVPPFEELVDRCGEALYGAKGVALMRELAAVPDTGAPSVDLQMRLAAAYGTHPVNDAAILAAAWVAATRREPELLDMAAEVVEVVGGSDRVDEVTKGEPREVRRGGAELARRIERR